MEGHFFNCKDTHFSAKKNKKGDELLRPLESFHNGIILIVNCLKSGAKVQLFFIVAKFIFSVAGKLPKNKAGVETEQS